MDAAGNGGTTGAARRRILRPYATAGVAIVGTGLIAVTPVAAPLSGMHRVIDVELAAGGELLDAALSPWTQIFNTASENSTTLFNAFSLSGNVAWEQLIANLNGYAQLVLDDPSNITQVTDALREDWKAVDSAITLMNANPDTVDAIIRQTMDGSTLSGHTLMFGQIPGYLPADQADMIQPIINFLGSPWGGVIMGSLGPGISPWVALLNSMINGDSFGQIMASPLNGFLNGATLDLSALTPMINGLGLFPEGMEMTHLDIAFGGLLSPGGNVAADPLSLVDADGTVTGDQVAAIGGSIFNSVGITFTGVPVVNTLQLDSDPIGPLGAWLGLNQVIASQLGWGTGWWDGKNSRPEVPSLPPGSDTDFPTIPDGFPSDYYPPDDAGVGAAEATDFASMLQDLFTGVGG
ncbi:hypothetical protein AWC24_02180 [Mycolicibacter senuensis]|nr:hypothetical protein AWC24_02180 [Mycolicibacter senuensis]